MRKNVFGRRLKRNKNQRKALFKSLLSALVLQERIKTTEAKAKAIKGQAEKLITAVKKKGEKAKNDLYVYLTPNAIEKLIKDIAPLFEKRQGGYTRILKSGTRFDSSSMVIMEWTEQVESGKLRVENQKKPASTEITEGKKKTRERKEAQSPKTRKRKLSGSK